MKNAPMPFYLLITFLLVNTIGFAENPNGTAPKQSNHNYKQEESGCAAPVDSFDLHINSVRAPLLDGGDLWFDHWQIYTVQDTAFFGLNTPSVIFAGAIWISALDQGNNLKVAALERRQSGVSDYYTGPLDNTGNVTLATCNQWDRHFPVFAADIIPCITAYNIPSNNHQVPISVVCAMDSNMIRWPGKGNPYLAAQGYDVSGVLAPFFDANGDGIYNPLDGDYPTLKQSGTLTANAGAGCDSLQSASNSNYADEMVFWVMNDAGNSHTISGGAPLGIQINTMAFAFQDTNYLNSASFYTYHVINKSGAVLNQAYFSEWTDPWLGCNGNNRVGCDTSRNIAITYKGYDAGNNQNGISCGWGSVCPTSIQTMTCSLPLLGIQFLQGAVDTAIDPTTQQPKKLGMTSFCYYTAGADSAQQAPVTTTGFRNYQQNLWNDGTHFTYGGDGYGGSINTNFLFPGNPAISNQWSECNQQTGPSIAAGDRQFVQTTGPFTFMPCSSQYFTIAVLYIDPPGGVGSNCPNWSYIDTAADSAQALFDRDFYHQNPLLTSVQSIFTSNMKVYPNPVSNLLYITSSGQQPIEEVYIYDMMGRLVIYQATKACSVDMSKLCSGVYFVKTNTDREQTFKIVKK